MSDAVSAPVAAPVVASAEAPSAPAGEVVETPKAAPPPPPSKIKLSGKVDGKDVTEELTQEELTAKWQKFRAGEARLAEAATTRKQLEARLAALQEDPFADPEIGEKLRQRAAKKLLEDFEAEQLKAQDPKEFELRGERAKREALEAKLAEHQKAQEKQQFEALVAETQETLMQTYGSALQRSGLPVNEETFIKMAEIGALNLDHGLDLTPEQLAQETKEWFAAQDTKATTAAKARLATLKGEELFKELGEDVAKEIQRTWLARARGAQSRPPPPPQAPAPQETERQPTKTLQQLRREMGVGIVPVSRD